MQYKAKAQRPILLRAEHLGMCFGVRDALEIARELPTPTDVTIYGELVHNPVVLDELEARGFAQQPEGPHREPPATPATLLTAHGVSDRERRRLTQAGTRLIDTTCPLVQKAHDAARRLEAEGFTLVVIGKPDHVEVRGLVGDLSRYVVVENPGQVRRWGFTRIAVIAQTTTRPEDAQAVVDAVRRLHPEREVRWHDTICQPTKDRGRALEDLLARVEALVVVGGQNSNNTRQLAQRALERGIEAKHVQGTGQLERNWLRRFSVVGLTAGTSTLPETVDAVEAEIRALQRS